MHHHHATGCRYFSHHHLKGKEKRYRQCDNASGFRVRRQQAALRQGGAAPPGLITARGTSPSCSARGTWSLGNVPLGGWT
eukprot:185640-Rhodomonas_salina.5